MNVLIRSAAAALAVLHIGGCAARTVPPPRETPPASVTPPRETPPATVKPPRETPPATVAPPPVPSVPADNNYVEGLAAMQQGRHERALELFATVWKDRPGHPGVEENFPAALEGLKKSGDEASRQGRPEDAGKRWTAAQRFLPHPALKGRGLSFSRADLKGSVDKLSEGLMEKGLTEYRAGKIEAAIATWRQILAYDPGNEEAARSVRTATTQLENLKKITPPAPPK